MLRDCLKSQTLKVFDPGKYVIALEKMASPEPEDILRKPLGSLPQLLRQLLRKFLICICGLCLLALGLLVSPLQPAMATNEAAPLAATVNQAPFLIVDKYYYNQSYDNPSCLSDVSTYAVRTTCNYNLSTHDFPLAAKWEIKHLSTLIGYYQIRSSGSGKCLQAIPGQAMLAMQACSTSATGQYWYLQSTGYRTKVAFQSLVTGNYLNFMAESGTAVATQGAYRSLALVPVASNSAPLQIRARHSGKCLDVRNNVNGGQDSGTTVQQWDCLGAGQTNQLFVFHLIGETGDLDYEYRLDPVHSTNKIIEPWIVNGASTPWNPASDYFKNGIQIVQGGIGGGPWEQWYFKLVRWQEDYLGFEIVLQHNDKCMDVHNVTNNGLNNGEKIQQWDCLGGGQLNQIWQFRRP